MKQKLIMLSIVIFIGSMAFGQDRLTVSTMKMGPFKLQMNKLDVEKILNQKIVFKLGENEYLKTADVNYKDYLLKFMFQSMTESNNPDSLEVYSISTKVVRIKTLSGLGIGNTKLDLFNAYSDKYDVSLYSAYEYNYTTEKHIKVPETRTFSLSDNDLYTQLQFTLVNNFVTEITVSVNEGD